jgi:hypothetical protein
VPANVANWAGRIDAHAQRSLTPPRAGQPASSA